MLALETQLLVDEILDNCSSQKVSVYQIITTHDLSVGQVFAVEKVAYAWIGGAAVVKQLLEALKLKKKQGKGRLCLSSVVPQKFQVC